MYFLRRRHGRKPQSETRRESPPVAAPLEYAEPQEIEPPRPVVIRKAKRPSVAVAEDEDRKPAGTFRAGTLHIARAAETDARQGEH